MSWKANSLANALSRDSASYFPSSFDNIMLWSASLLYFFGFLEKSQSPLALATILLSILIATISL